MFNSQLYKDIAEKRRQLYDRHGGIMSPVDLSKELGYKKYENAERWAREHNVPAIQLGPRKRGYESDLVAKAIVQSRGML